jgi:hypothetical protein
VGALNDEVAEDFLCSVLELNDEVAEDFLCSVLESGRKLMECLLLGQLARSLSYWAGKIRLNLR